jgi:hypothetical protein
VIALQRNDVPIYLFRA